MAELTWDELWMGFADKASEKSKDRSRQIGAVIVGDDNRMVSMGWNGFPRGVDDDVEERHQRPAKYLWTEHAERNALYNAAAVGAAVKGSAIYQTMFPCADCARGIVQSGIRRVVTVEPDWNDPTYAEQWATAKEMFDETGVEVQFVEGTSPVRVEDISLT